MADLLSFEKGPTGVFDHAETLDSLWAEAEALGKVGVDHTFSGGYRATVNFHTASGSNVFAHGEGKRPHEALRGAMAEARSLGAGRCK
ncbi:hypothetical protein [Leisingera daeponensis]|jgi:hypothetical protein|uniref:hypothetical protein n=1 Tax=Leisingera daeponensis TaxID=405746 RepID=UPI001C978853|nr:hypothetical protein [Leisingera daeponensis]MBY6055356.1 hypothetical protein [Leisingera daeponensis]